MYNDLNKTWEQIQGLLSKTLKGPSFQCWIKPTQLLEIQDEKVVIGVKNEFTKSFLTSAYFEKISEACENILKRKINLIIQIKEDLNLDDLVPSIASLSNVKYNNEKNEPISPAYLDHTFKYKSNLNPSYTFENFIVGDNNNFCQAVGLSASELTNNQFNPLFIHSGVGLGKTHLVNAIGNEALIKNASSKVCYLSSESFTNDLITSIKSNKMSTFRDKYRTVDILIIDDVQFLEGKEATQEEFFHTFNSLVENGKKVILTADRSPSELSSLTDRLRSRFEGGLIADIQPPNLETRMAILSLKGNLLGLVLNNDVVEYIAQVYSGNIRELEGALKRVHAYLSFSGQELNLRNVEKLINKHGVQNISPLNVVQAVANYYRLNFDELVGPSKTPLLTAPRHIAVYLLHEFYDLSFPKIGEIFSNRSHSSAMYSFQQVKKKLQNDKSVYEDVSAIRRLLEKR